MDRGFLENETKGHENNYIFHKVIVVATFFFFFFWCNGYTRSIKKMLFR